MPGMMQLRRCTIFAGLLMLGFVYSSVTADDQTLIVSPISAVPSNQVHNGKLVWVDLVTTDPPQAVEFYSTVFGWQAHYFADKNYIELTHDGRVMSSVVRYDGDEPMDGEARWLVSMSVTDVDAAARHGR